MQGTFEFIFWTRYLIVTSADNEIVTVTRPIYSGQCKDCHFCEGNIPEENPNPQNKAGNILPPPNDFNQKSFSFHVNPNPSETNNISIQFSSSENEILYFSLRDQTGRVIQSWKSNTTKRGWENKYISLENMPSGIYFLIGSNNKETQAQKIIKL